MRKKSESIKRKLMRVILITCSVVLFLTYASYFIYEFIIFRQVTKAQLSTLGKIVAANSTAAVAFDNHGDANEILDALKAEKNITAAALYDRNGHLFARYPVSGSILNIPNKRVPKITGLLIFAWKDLNRLFRATGG